MEPIPDEPRCFGQAQIGRRCQRRSAITRYHDCGDYYCNVRMERSHHVCLDPHGARHRLIDKCRSSCFMARTLTGTASQGGAVAASDVSPPWSTASTAEALNTDVRIARYTKA